MEIFGANEPYPEPSSEAICDIALELRITKTSLNYSRSLLVEQSKEFEEYRTKMMQRRLDLEEFICVEQKKASKQQSYIRQLLAEVNDLKMKNSTPIHGDLIKFNVKHHVMQRHLNGLLILQNNKGAEENQHHVTQQQNCPSVRGQVGKQLMEFKKDDIQIDFLNDDKALIHRHEEKIRKPSEELASATTSLRNRIEDGESAHAELLLQRKENLKIIQENEDLKKQLHKEVEKSVTLNNQIKQLSAAVDMLKKAKTTLKQIESHVGRLKGLTSTRKRSDANQNCRLKQEFSHAEKHDTSLNMRKRQKPNDQSSEDDSIYAKLQKIEAKNKELKIMLSRKVEIFVERGVKVEQLSSEVPLTRGILHQKTQKDQRGKDKLLLERKNNIVKLQKSLELQKKQSARQHNKLMVEIKELRSSCSKYLAEKKQMLVSQSHSKQLVNIQKRKYDDLKRLFDDQYLKMKQKDKLIKEMSQIVDHSGAIVEDVARHHRHRSLRAKSIQRYPAKCRNRVAVK